MKKKYQVFISSTYIDLKEERQAVVEAVLEAGHIPAGMELFKSGKSQLDTIKKWIDVSDIYVLILGGRYGSIDKEIGKSYTHLEYQYALDKKMPVFAIIIDEDTTNAKLSKMKPEDVIEVHNRKKYDEFKEFVMSKIVKFSKTLEGVKLSIHQNIHQFETDYDLKGWVRGDNLKATEKLQEKNIKLTEKNSKLELQLQKLKSKDKDKRILKSGYLYEEIKKLLETKKITIPKGKLGFKEDKELLLIIVFLTFKDRFATGISNSSTMSNENNYVYFRIAPHLITLGLLENNKNTGKTYRTTTLTEDGKKFITLYELEQMKKSLEQNV